MYLALIPAINTSYIDTVKVQTINHIILSNVNVNLLHTHKEILRIKITQISNICI